MKLSLAVGILTSKTLLPVVSEAKVLSITKHGATDDPRSPVLRGGSNLVHAGSTSTTPFKKTTKKKTAVECIPPPQGEFMEADYDLGVLATCATSSTGTAIEGQVCVPSIDSTLGGYCMDPPFPFTDAADSRHLLKGFSGEGLFLKFCEDGSISAEELSLISPLDSCRCQLDPVFTVITCSIDPEKVSYDTCELEIRADYTYAYSPDGSLVLFKEFFFGSTSSVVRYSTIGFPPLCFANYNESYCDCTLGAKGVTIDCSKLDNGFTTDTSQVNPWKTVPACKAPEPTEAPTLAPKPTDAPTLVPKPTDAPTLALKPTDSPTLAPKPTDAPTLAPKPTDAPTLAPKPTDSPTMAPKPTDAPTMAPKPTKSPKPTKAPKPNKTPKPTKTPRPNKAPKPKSKKPRELVSSETTDADPAERLLSL